MHHIHDNNAITTIQTNKQVNKQRQSALAMFAMNIYEKNQTIIYKSTLCSKASLFIIITTLLSIAIPFILAYRSRGFWLKHDTFYEQPTVEFKGEYLFYGLTNNISNTIVCSNLLNLGYDCCNMIKVREIDKNYDRINDFIEFSMEIDLPDYERLTEFTLMLIFDYKLKTVCKLQMETAIVLQKYLPRKLNGLELIANLKLQQTDPLHCFHKGIDVLHNNSILNRDNDFDSFKLTRIFNDYLERNLTTYLDNVFTSQIVNNNDNFLLRLKVRFPEHQLYYRPGFWQVMKWAWIQYFAIYVLFAWFICKINNYVFDNNLVLFYKPKRD